MRRRMSVCVLLSMLLAANNPGTPLQNSALAAEQAKRAESGDGKEAREARKKELDEMRRRAENTIVQEVGEVEKKRAKVSPEPLFRYSDQPRRIIDATLWGYSVQGRPAALEKIEAYARPGQPKWFYCLASLSDGLVETQWPDGPHWAALKPGLTLQPLPQGAQPAQNAAGRLRQMKDSIRRFAATLTDIGVGAPMREEIRLIPAPICRYSEPDSGLQDGAIFGFAANGTNPDLLLVLELHGKDLAAASWKCAPVRMTVAQLSVRLDEKEVWSVPYVYAPAPGRTAAFDTWVFFCAKDEGSPQSILSPNE
jgi:hypothetical protein